MVKKPSLSHPTKEQLKTYFTFSIFPQESDFLSRLNSPILFYRKESMNTQDTINYNRVAEAIDYLKQHFKEQPSLDEVAAKIHLSPFHFQRLFSEWAGTTPKKFLQFLTLEYAKSLLQKSQFSIADVAYETGLSGTSRLHDLFINLEGMTPAEYKNGGKELLIQYSYASSFFGEFLVASTSKGICFLAFETASSDSLIELQQLFPKAQFVEKQTDFHLQAIQFFQRTWEHPTSLHLHLKATPFQLKVWESLLKIPFGEVATYGAIASKINNPTAQRAVGTAIGSNPVAYLIPCHRVIQSSGQIGGYKWGPTRKSAILGWESALLTK